MRKKGHTFDEIESLINRLFAEKQLAVALLVLVMMANLMSSQFLLLRTVPPAAQAVTAVAPDERLDANCVNGALRGLQGQPLNATELTNKRVVLHLDGAANQCVVAATQAGVEHVVVGVTVEGDGAP